MAALPACHAASAITTIAAAPDAADEPRPPLVFRLRSRDGGRACFLFRPQQAAQRVTRSLMRCHLKSAAVFAYAAATSANMSPPADAITAAPGDRRHRLPLLPPPPRAFFFSHFFQLIFASLLLIFDATCFLSPSSAFFFFHFSFLLRQLLSLLSFSLPCLFFIFFSADFFFQPRFIVFLHFSAFSAAFVFAVDMIFLLLHTFLFAAISFLPFCHTVFQIDTSFFVCFISPCRCPRAPRCFSPALDLRQRKRRFLLALMFLAAAYISLMLGVMLPL